MMETEGYNCYECGHHSYREPYAKTRVWDKHEQRYEDVDLCRECAEYTPQCPRCESHKTQQYQYRTKERTAQIECEECGTVFYD